MKKLFLLILSIAFLSCSSDSSDSDNNNNNDTSSQKVLELVGESQYDRMQFFYSDDKLSRVINYVGDYYQLFYDNDVLSYVKMTGSSFGSSSNYDENFDLTSCNDCLVYDYNYEAGRITSILREGHSIMEYDYNGSYLSETRFYTYDNFPTGQELHRRIQYTYTSGKLSGYAVTETDSGSTHTYINTVTLDDKKNPFFDFETYTGLYLPDAPTLYARQRLHVNPYIRNNITNIYDSTGADIFNVVYQYDNNDYPTSYVLTSTVVANDSGTFTY